MFRPGASAGATETQGLRCPGRLAGSRRRCSADGVVDRIKGGQVERTDPRSLVGGDAGLSKETAGDRIRGLGSAGAPAGRRFDRERSMPAPEARRAIS